MQVHPYLASPIPQDPPSKLGENRTARHLVIREISWPEAKRFAKLLKTRKIPRIYGRDPPGRSPQIVAFRVDRDQKRRPHTNR